MSSYYNYGYSEPKPSFPKLENPIKIDWSLFFTLLYKQTPSKSAHQDRFINWLKDRLEKTPGVRVSQDKFGNLYAVKGDTDLYPCVIAHTDINQYFKKELRVERTDKFVYGMDNETGLQCGVGFDDKNGCLFALMMFDLIDEIKIAFFKDEEIGAVGSKQANAEFFRDCSMIFQMDRNSYKGLELITRTNGVQVCSKEFVEAATPFMEKYHVTEGTGSFTDVGEIVKLAGVDCIGCNLGAGYFDEHSEQEVTSIQALENSINFGYECLTTLGKTKWEHKATSEYALKPTTVNYGERWSDDYEIDDWNSSFEQKKFKLKIPTYKYRHHLQYDDIPDSHVIMELKDGYCPCCYSTQILKYDDCTDMLTCGNCGDFFFVPESYFENEENPEGLFD